MPRCLFVIGDALWTGRARALVTAARGLAARGSPAQVLAPERSAAHTEALRDGAKLEVFPLPSPGQAAGTARVRAIRRAMRQGDIDVVFVHSDVDQLAVALAMVALGRRPVLVRRLSIGERWRPTRTARVAERLQSAIPLATGRGGVERADGGGGAGKAADDRFRVELGVPLPSVGAASAVRPGALLACAYDADMPVHAVRVLRAVTMLRKRHRDLALCMMATADVPERLRMQAAALGLSRVVRWLRTPAAAADVLSQAASLVVASGGDEAAFATLDGMAYAVPVVAPRGALFERYVANGISGILLDRFDAPACAAALATLISDPERCAAMGGAGQARVAREFAEQEYINGIETVLRSLVSDAGEPIAGVA